MLVMEGDRLGMAEDKLETEEDKMLVHKKVASHTDLQQVHWLRILYNPFCYT